MQKVQIVKLLKFESAIKMQSKCSQNNLVDLAIAG
jgi:hypothetical protein